MEKPEFVDGIQVLKFRNEVAAQVHSWGIYVMPGFEVHVEATPRGQIVRVLETESHHERRLLDDAKFDFYDSLGPEIGPAPATRYSFGRRPPLE